MIKKYYNKLSAYPRLRIGLIVLIIIVLFVVVTNIFSSGSVKRSVIPPSRINHQDIQANREHSVAAEQYSKLSNIEHRKTLDNAEKSGKTYFDKNLLQGGSKVEEEKKKAEKKAQKPAVNPEDFYKKKMKEASKVNVVAQPEPKTRVIHVAPHPVGASHAQLEAAAEQLKGAMQTQLTQMAGHWTIPSDTTVVGEAPKESSAGTGTAATGSVAIKAGSILFAVLNTALNSDQSGTPVLATIVSGKYRGAKLMGSFTREKDRLVVKFNLMTLASVSHSISINAYAIDAKTAQNALASSVNNHYLLRYGSLFASAFLEGFGNAFSQVNLDQGSGGLFNIYNAPRVAPTTKQAMYQGLGQVGTNLGNNMKAVFNTPPTVKLKQGTGMGILFMSDVSM